MAGEFYADYDRLIRLACPDYDLCLELIARNIPSNTKSLLDLGTGTGNLILSILKKHPSIRIYGVELQQSLIDIANRKIGRSNVSLIQGDILRCDWPAADCITSSLTIHNLNYEQKAKVLRRVFKNSDFFLYFDRVKGKDKREEEDNLSYIFDHMRRNQLSEEMIKKAEQEMARNDMPLTVKEQNKLFSQVGFDYDLLYLKHGFAIYFCTKKE